MTDNATPTLDLAALRLGTLVLVHGDGPIPYDGYVDDTFPQLNVVWIRELRTGERKMLFTDECCIHPARSSSSS